MITGGSHGIGLSIVKRYLSMGWNVINLDISFSSTFENINEQEQIHYHYIHTDLSDIVAINDSVKCVKDKFDNINAFIHCAAHYSKRPRFEATVEEWMRSLMINLISPCLLINQLINLFHNSDKCSIVFIGSIAGSFAESRYYPYSVSKGAMISLVKQLAYELPTIRVNLISCGTVWSERLEEKFKTSYGIKSKEEAKHIISKNIMNRVGDIKEISNVVQFLISDEASFITGTQIFVDGGFHVI
ncbi:MULTISPECIES: SDR family oxidoreductase [Paenibacillus]|uniref:SDR family oxidoreductase n=1 Tax=Paenibacillus TaxID=44249 RepID=UPI0015BBC9B1|nr:SDR family oxidoreductase [Paenibacillus odorifer]